MAEILRAERIAKSFGPVEVLSDIALSIESGAVHALIGENGAGKSTFMRILSGHLPPSGGELFLDGKPIRFVGPVEAEAAGIVLVHQEILLADDLTVAQNLFLGRERRRGFLVDDTGMRETARKKLAELGSTVDPDLPVRRLSIADRQLVQIARALLVPHRLVIFDEPTAVLTPVEAEALFRVVRTLREQGAAVLYISHRLPEVKAIADRVTVLRDGRHVGTYPAADLSPLDMARLMVGRDMSQLYPEKPDTAAADVVLEVRDASVPPLVEHASFVLRRGEILGFAGLIGAGRTELFEGLLGLRTLKGGQITLKGQSVTFRDAREAMRAGIVYLSEDRKGKGLLLRQDLQTNLTLAGLDRFTRGLFIDAARESAELDRAVTAFDIRARRRDMLAGQLSGGNQQKLLLAKMMLIEPGIVVVDEPTRGIDIGTKAQIYRFIAKLAEEGRSVVVISSEMQELIGVCHRILVMRAGRIVGEVAGSEMTEDRIVVLATGVDEGRAAA